MGRKERINYYKLLEKKEKHMTDKLYKAEIPATLTVITDGLTKEEATEAIELIIKHYRQTSYLANLSIDVNVNYKADYKVEEFEPF